MASDELRPIIIKKKKVVGGDGHHGGAWKVAYADFVTAMMAFFLLMWLLNATTEKQRKGLADYFSPTIPMNRVSGGGDGNFWGDDVFAEDSLAQNGNGASMLHPTEQRQAKGDTGLDTREARVEETPHEKNTAAEELLEELKLRGGESMAALDRLRHVVTRLSDEGLVIEVFDLPDLPLFVGDTAEPTQTLSWTLEDIGRVLPLVTNDVAVRAHLAVQPIVVADKPVWKLSAARAETARRLLIEAGLPEAQMHEVTGGADRSPVDDNPMSVRNNRLEIVVLRDDL